MLYEISPSPHLFFNDLQNPLPHIFYLQAFLNFPSRDSFTYSFYIRIFFYGYLNVHRFTDLFLLLFKLFFPPLQFSLCFRVSLSFYVLLFCVVFAIFTFHSFFSHNLELDFFSLHTRSCVWICIYFQVYLCTDLQGIQSSI